MNFATARARGQWRQRPVLAKVIGSNVRDAWELNQL
jgi:hypothetical protein